MANIIRQGIIGKDEQVVGFEILYEQTEETVFSKGDTSTANVVENFLLHMDSEKFLEGKTAYITFTPNLLEKNIPKLFKPSKLVIQIDDLSVVYPFALDLVYKYKAEGYKIALTGFDFAPRYLQMFDAVDIIKVDLSKYDDSNLDHVSNMCKNFGKTIIAYNVDTKEAYDKATSLKIDLMQGGIVAENKATSIKRVEHLEGNFFHLMIAATRDEPDIDEITEIVSRDVSLSYSIIKMVNSAYFALRHKATSVKQAILILGLGQLKQWIYLLSFGGANGQEPAEIIKVSFLRATFCSELVKYIDDLPISKSEAYLMGMFSTLGILLNVELEVALEPLPISDEVKEALLTREGMCGTLYSLAVAYERGNWKEASAAYEELGLTKEIVTTTYMECVESVNNIWKSLTTEYEAE